MTRETGKGVHQHCGHQGRRIRRGRRSLWLAAMAAAGISGLTIPGTAHATTLYWDLNGTIAGAGGASPSGTWNTSNINWSTSSGGLATTSAWIGGSLASFSAGTDATGSYTGTVAGNQPVGGIIFIDGQITPPGVPLPFSGLVTAATT